MRTECLCMYYILFCSGQIQVLCDTFLLNLGSPDQRDGSWDTHREPSPLTGSCTESVDVKCDLKQLGFC